MFTSTDYASKENWHDFQNGYSHLHLQMSASVGRSALFYKEL